MAQIQVNGARGTVVLSKPDEEGRYSWTCHRGHREDAHRQLEDTIADAEIHADMRCRGTE